MKQETYRLEPTTIIIFGGTGDLANKKLIPALIDLYVKDALPTPFRVVGFSRKAMSHEDYRAFMRSAMAQKGHGHPETKVNNFLKNVFYQQGDFTKQESYDALANVTEQMDRELSACPHRLFYLAVPPQHYEDIFEKLCTSRIGQEKEDHWVRILVEKPFGHDYKSAKALDKKLGSLFEERQIFRIDHYLAKGSIQNILTLRFANSIFEDSWNKSQIAKVHIRLAEDFGVEKRASFYDGIGALRDVGQNHMLQMLALVTMENPGVLEADHLRRARETVLSALRIYGKDEVAEHVVRGQYAGYTDIENVPDSSATETYFLLRAFVDNERWRDVPFYLESGKCLNETKTEITVYFRSPPKCICGGRDLSEAQNVVTIGVKPKQDVRVRFWVKKPGLEYNLEPCDLMLACINGDENGNGIPDAYEKVIFDCLRGDQTLFTSTGEVTAAWKFITPIMHHWQNLPLERYAGGSTGPAGNFTSQS